VCSASRSPVRFHYVVPPFDVGMGWGFVCRESYPIPVPPFLSSADRHHSRWRVFGTGRIDLLRVPRPQFFTVRYRPFSSGSLTHFRGHDLSFHKSFSTFSLPLPPSTLTFDGSSPLLQEIVKTASTPLVNPPFFFQL